MSQPDNRCLLRVFFATRAEAPEVDVGDRPLLDALTRRGVSVEAAVWSDASVDWSSADLCLLRSTWDYHKHYAEFLSWTEHVALVTRLWNDVDLVRWNSDKRYLQELERAGIPIVPTTWVRRDESVDLAALLDSHAWSSAVVKPVVSADSFGTRRVHRSSAVEAQRHLDELLRMSGVMIQPFLASVETYGERSLIFINRAHTHTVHRGDVFGQGLKRSVVGSAEPDELEVALSALGIVQQPVHYARVDLVRDQSGVCRLMELELVEPSLMFDLAPEAAEQFADHIARSIVRH